jgi:NIMA (never in mitosis gene a)-related kinase
MDFADGGDLYTKIAQYKKLGKMFDEEQIIEWFLQICLALKHIHSRRILHRDLKTQNIFLTSKGEVKIGDFGIARVLQHTYDCVQTAIGTPYYLSPEICQEKPYNQKSDIWSMGCILYEMLTLRHAFDANSMKGLVLKILKGIYPPIPSHYSDDMKSLISELLTKDPAKRPSIRQILDKPFLKSRINNLIAKTVAKHELTSNPKAKLPQISSEVPLAEVKAAAGAAKTSSEDKKLSDKKKKSELESKSSKV